MTTPQTNLGTAVVTGASSGIGKVYADRLAQRGYHLILVARRADRLDVLAKDLQERYGISAVSLVADLSDPTELDRVAQALTNDPSITMLVNNAGTNAAGPFATLDRKDLGNLIDLNVLALSRLTLAVLPGLQSRNRGAIINIGSVVGFHAYPGTAVYSGSKAYVLQFTRALQQELAGTAVRVQLVCPAATVSEIWDIQGWSLANLDPSIVMTTEDCVDASLRGLDLGEATTAPSVHDLKLLTDFDTAAAALAGASQSTGKPASRYTAAR